MDTPQIENSSVEVDPQPGRAPHEHGWSAQSRHRTSAGVVLYVRCVACGARRVDLQSVSENPPSALSVVMPGGA